MTPPSPDTRQLLDELYAIDPELRKHEAQLLPLLQRLLRERPDQEASPAFVETLRRQLRERGAALSSISSPFLTMQKLLFAFGGAALALVVAVPLLYTQTGQPVSNESAPSLFSYSISSTGKEAFGSLSVADSLPAGRGGDGPAMNMARPQSGGGGGGGSEAYDSKLIAPDSMIVNPDMVQFQYTYSGSLPALPEGTVGILSRQKNGAKLMMSALAGRFNVDAINLDSFGDASVDSISFSQNVSKGYSFYMDLREGTVGISPQWEKWPNPQAQCKDEACFRRFQLKPGDIPADDVLIAIADAFVKDHGIDLETYGKPEVDRQWMRDYERAADKSFAYVPDVQRIVYPLLLKDQTVYEEGGQKNGLSVGVNVREKAVVDIYGIMNQTYAESQYPAVHDEALVKSFIEKLDAFPKDFRPTGVKVRTVNVELGEPTMAYTHIYKYDNNQSQELVVPALIFPIKSPAGSDQPWRQSVVVPLAEDLLKDRLNDEPVHVLDSVER